MNVLVIDIGTSSMRGIVYREDGRKLFSKQITYQPVHGADGQVEQPAEDFEKSLLAIMKAAGQREEASEIEAVAVTAQRSSIIPVDRNGAALCNAVMWQDTRNREICAGLKKHDKRVAELSGATVNTVFSGGKMLWLKRNRPQIYEKTYKLLNIPEYLLHLMTGNYVSDYTYGSRSNLMNVRKKCWDEELLQIFDMKKEHLCRLKEPGSISGFLTESFAAVTGLKAGIPVISSGGDQQCAAVGQGAFEEGVISIVAGTGAFLVTTCSEVPKENPAGMICNCAAVPGKYILEANVLTCCSAFDWFCQNFYDWQKVDYRRINEELEQVYEKETDCIVLPYFQGRSTPDWNPLAKGMFANITLATGRQDILKALLEGIFLEVNSNILEMQKYEKIDCAYISGGMTNSDVINRMQADIYGMPLYRMADSESTAIGALLIALYGLGVYPTLKDGFDTIRKEEACRTYDFDPRKHFLYRKKLDDMKQLYSGIYKQEEKR